MHLNTNLDGMTACAHGLFGIAVALVLQPVQGFTVLNTVGYCDTVFVYLNGKSTVKTRHKR